jgi:hypothetical protein
VRTLVELLEELRTATPRGWYVGSPSFDDRYSEWVIHAFDPSSPATNGLRAREWTSIGSTEERAIQTMTACLRHIGAGRVPT